MRGRLTGQDPARVVRACTRPPDASAARTQKGRSRRPVCAHRATAVGLRSPVDPRLHTPAPSGPAGVEVRSSWSAAASGLRYDGSAGVAHGTMGFIDSGDGTCASVCRTAETGSHDPRWVRCAMCLRAACGQEMSDPTGTLKAWRSTFPASTTASKSSAITSPSGDQPTAIDDLERRVRRGDRHTVLLGATGTGKSATTAWLIERMQRPTLVMAPNKTLAAQLAKEFRELLPNNAVEYFVSYYDYYQPEAYIPQTDTYIEKDSSVNDEVERLRHSTTMSLLTRRDVIVVATVSAIYGLGTPQEYVDQAVRLKVGQEIERDQLLRRLVDIQYARNDLAFQRGTFRVRGDTLEIIPAYEELAIRVEFFGDEIEKLYYLHPLTGDVVREVDELMIFPASHYAAGPERMERTIRDIEAELAERLAELEQQNKLLEAQRLRMRTTYDIEMMRQVGFCSGIENYSMHIDGRTPGEPPNCLLDYFPDDFLTVIDESHVTVPQIGGMYEGDASRKRHAGRPRVPAAVGAGQPAAAVRRVHRARRPDGVPVRDARHRGS